MKSAELSRHLEELDREGFDEVVAGIFRRGVVSAAPIERTAAH